MVEDNEIEIVDVENYQNPKEKTYNAQNLIMEQMALCLKNGSVDTDDTGGWEAKYDKNGNYSKTYRDDRRKVFINTIKSLMMFVHRDYKDDVFYNKKIDDKITNIAARRVFWQSEEWKWWESLSQAQKNDQAKQNRAVSKGCFNKNLDFDNFYYDEETQVYREIFTLISDFIKDKMKDYEAEVYTG